MINYTQRIYLHDWLEFKPYTSQVKSDSFYLDMCNKVKQTILDNADTEVLNKYIDDDDIQDLSCFLTSYFEDVVSRLGVWESFVNAHVELYNKPVPFYNFDDYYDDEINEIDVCFLLWYFVNSVQNERFTSPYMPEILSVANAVYTLFDDAWEYAPENSHLKKYYTIDEHETDYYIARNLIDTVLFKTYLFFPDTGCKLLEFEAEIIEKHADNKNFMAFLNDARDNLFFSSHTHLLAMHGKDWAARILGQEHALCNEYKNISKKITGYFFYKGQDEYDIHIEHMASGKKFNLTKKSFDTNLQLTKIDTIIYIGIVQWQQEWWFSGIYSQQDFDADLVLDEKNSIQSRSAVNFLDHKQENVEEILATQLKAFKKAYGGKQIVFFESNLINTYIEKFTEQYNNSLGLSKNESDEAKQRARNEGFFDSEHDNSLNVDENPSCLLFFNPKSGVEVAIDVNSAFPLPHNPFYDEGLHVDHFFNMCMSPEISAELVYFCIETAKSKLNVFKTLQGQMVANDLDFLLRFWKKSRYISVPEITFTGNIKK